MTSITEQQVVFDHYVDCIEREACGKKLTTCEAIFLQDLETNGGKQGTPQGLWKEDTDLSAIGIRAKDVDRIRCRLMLAINEATRDHPEQQVPYTIYDLVRRLIDNFVERRDQLPAKPQTADGVVFRRFAAGTPKGGDCMVQADYLYTLVIVGMQTGFSASWDERTIAGVMAEIHEAVTHNVPIIFVVSDPSRYGQIERRLLELVQGYNKYYRYRDYYSDSSGAMQVAEACEVFEYTCERFRICGVNTHINVFFTAMELAKRFPGARLEIVERACNDAYAADPRDARMKFEYYSRDHKFSNFIFDSE